VIGKIYVAEGTENNLDSHKERLASVETNNAIAARKSEINDSVNNENPPVDLLSTIWQAIQEDRAERKRDKEKDVEIRS
jgi:hypothetical protein